MRAGREGRHSRPSSWATSTPSPTPTEIRYLRGLTPLGGRSVYFADCFAVAGDGSAGHTFARSNDFAAMLREPNRRIDYIFVRGPDERFRGEPLDAPTAFTTRPAGVLPSDHYGVVADRRIVACTFRGRRSSSSRRSPSRRGSSTPSPAAAGCSPCRR